MTAQDLIDHLQLLPHPEGGHYKETYRAAMTVEAAPGKIRSVSTAIYFLLQEQEVSVFHRIQSDEGWFFHQGQALEVVYIQQGQLVTVVLGNNVSKGEVPQTVIPANTWFGSRLRSGSGYGLVSCTVAPGFDFADFEMARREQLLQDFPHLEEEIRQFTR